MTNTPYPHSSPPRKSSGAPKWIIVIAGGIFVLVAVIGVVAALGIYGVRKYIADSKEAEARNAVGQLAKDAAAAYVRDGKLCRSTSSPVPATVPHGTKYQSTPGDWEAGKAAHAGFGCLRFSMSYPQYYQYDYRSTPRGFTAIARGDLDGDGVQSRFELDGHLSGGVISIVPNLKETNPDE